MFSHGDVGDALERVTMVILYAQDIPNYNSATTTFDALPTLSSAEKDSLPITIHRSLEMIERCLETSLPWYSAPCLLPCRLSPAA